MIINKDVYECPKCRKWHFFDTSKEFSTVCPRCNVEMEFQFNADADTERAERVKNTPPYDPTQDPASPYYTGTPIVNCPYCHSPSTRKIGIMGRSLSVGLFGFGSSKVGKQWHCTKCGSDF